MLPRIVDAYFEEGHVFEMGSPALLGTGVTPVETWTPYRLHQTPRHSHVGISLRDAWFIRLCADALGPARSLVIGNSHGISTMLIAEALRPEPLDAIDAETSMGSDSGTELTRRVAERLGLDVRVTTGFSPQDLDAACRFDSYGFVMIDGEHTDEQILLDFQGIAHRCAERCIVFLHDVGLRDMDRGWLRVREIAAPMGFRGFDFSASDFGSSVLVRGVPELERMLERTCPGLRSHTISYHAGLSLPMPGHRPETDMLVLEPGERVAFYGSGNDLEHQGHFIVAHPDRVAGIFDDDPDRVGGERFGMTIQPGNALRTSNASAIVIATHAHMEAVRARAAERCPHIATYPRPGTLAPARVFCRPA